MLLQLIVKQTLNHPHPKQKLISKNLLGRFGLENGFSPDEI